MQLSNFDNETQEVAFQKKKQMNNSNEEDISDQTGVDKILFEYPPSSSSSAIQSSNSYSFDDLLSEMGFGKYQIVIFVLMGLIGMADAAESQVLSILQPILSDNWGLHTYQESLLISVVFVGYFVGSFFSGKISDRKGRKKPLQYGAILLFVCALASSFAPDFILFLIFRSIFGGCIGFIVPISFSVLAESTPVKQRGIVLALIGMFYTLGEMFVCLLSFFTLDNLKTGNWRLLLVLSTIPSLMIMIGAGLWLDESPRFLLLNKNYDEAFNVINKMITSSSNLIELDAPKKTLIIIWADETREQMKHFTQGTTKALFQGEFKKITPIIWYNWFVSSLVYFGITFILPLTLTAISGKDSSDDDNDDLMSIFISAVGELPAIAVCAIIVNVPFLGRKNSWALSFLGGFIGCMLIFFELGSFTFWVTFSKLSLDLAFTLSYEYTGEVYPTKIRAEGVGMAGSFSRIGSILMPWVGNYIGNIGIFLPYLLFGIFSGAASVFTFFLPFDTRGKKLDTVQNTNLTSGVKYV